MGAIAEAVAFEAPAIERARSPVDHAHLARYTFGNKALELEVLNLFADQAPDTLEQLRTATTEKAWRDAAHTLKGSARAVGAMLVGDRAEQAEALRTSPDPGARARALASLAEALDEARIYIASLGKQA